MLIKWLLKDWRRQFEWETSTGWKKSSLTARCSVRNRGIHWLDKEAWSLWGPRGDTRNFTWEEIPHLISLQVGKQTSIWKRCSAHLLSPQASWANRLYWKPATLKTFRELLNIKGRRVASFGQKSGERRCLYVHKYLLSTSKGNTKSGRKKSCVKCVYHAAEETSKQKQITGWVPLEAATSSASGVLSKKPTVQTLALMNQ